MKESPTERNARIFKEATEAGEPVFVIRAKDLTAIDAIRAYTQLAEKSTYEFLTALVELEDEFIEWRDNNPDKLKYPDLRN
jgi:tryptophan 2,3-dioxygenase